MKVEKGKRQKGGVGLRVEGGFVLDKKRSGFGDVVEI